MTTQPHDPFQTGAPSVSFDRVPIGTTYTLDVLELPTLVQARDFDTGAPAVYPDGNAKMTVVTRVRNRATGEELSLWAGKPSAMFVAIADAQKAAGSQIAVGGTLTVQFIGEKPNDTNPRLNPSKQYAVHYQPPNAFAPPDASHGAQPVMSAPTWAQPTGIAPPPAQPAPYATFGTPPQAAQPAPYAMGPAVNLPPGDPAWSQPLTQHAQPPAWVPPAQPPMAAPPQYPPQSPTLPAAGFVPPVGTNGTPPPVPNGAAPPTASAPTGPSPEQIAAVVAAGLDPAVVYPSLALR
jgi:hypothetical protein